VGNGGSYARHLYGLVFAILFVTGGTVSGATWTSINNGLPVLGAGASALAFDPASPATLYSWSDRGAVFKSMDGAANWIASKGLSDVHSLVIDPTNSSKIYALARNGIVRSTDGGATWVGANSGLPASYFTLLAIDPFNSSTLYAGATFVSLFRSTDGGESWTALNTGLPGGSLGSLTFDPITPSTIYAAGVNGAISKSTDGGESWITLKAPVTVGYADAVLSLAIDPTNPSLIYAGSFAAATGQPGPAFAGSGGIARSTNGGQSWSRINTGIPSDAFVRSLSMDPTAPSTIYGTYVVDGGWGMIKSMDRGESWSVINNGLPSGRFIGSNVLIDPNVPSTLYVGYVNFTTGIGGVVRSMDGGETWAAANTGRSTIDITVLTADPVDTATLYTAAGTEGLFKSVDHGASWSKLVDPWPGQYIRSLVVDYVRPSTLYAVADRTNGCFNVDDHLFKSTDGGAGWEIAGPRGNGCEFYPSSYLVMDPVDPSTLYVGGGGSFDDAFSAKTNNGGTSWGLFSVPMGMRVNAMVIDRTNPTTLYEGSWAGVFKSTDGGTTWTDLTLGLSVNTLALDPANPNVLYASTQGPYPFTTGFGGLFKSTNYGATWNAINTGLSDLIDARCPITSLVFDPADSNILYAGTAGYGVFKSIDGGATWTHFNDGLSGFDIRMLTVSPGTLFAGTRNGVFAIPITE
jgi:photosystem II stability/assembly factor-like uncharacterized protein